MSDYAITQVGFIASTLAVLAAVWAFMSYARQKSRLPAATRYHDLERRLLETESRLQEVREAVDQANTALSEAQQKQQTI